MKITVMRPEPGERPIVVHKTEGEASRRERLKRWSSLLGNGHAPARAFGGG